MSSSSSLLISISGSVFSQTSVLQWEKYVHAFLVCCNGNAWQNNSLKNSMSNHNHSNIPIHIKVSLLQLFRRFLSLHFAVKFLYLSHQLSGRLKTSAAEQRNGDILTTENLWKILIVVLRKSVLTAFTEGENLRDAVLVNRHYLRANLRSLQDENFCKNWKKKTAKVLTYLCSHMI